MQNKFIEKPANKNSISNRKLIFGVGVNDADYIVKPRVDGKRLVCPFYRRWFNMLNRCYNPRCHRDNPTYIDCSAATEWHYFTAFKAWMIAQDWEGMELDKDIINPGNKVYSPDNCRFVTQALNGLLNGCAAIRGDHPQGVSWHKSSQKYVAQININNKVTHLGLYKASESARNAYINAKTTLILQAAKEQKDPSIACGLRKHAELLNAE